MGTIWVSSSARGAADGTSYDNAYGSIADGLGDITAKGDVVNIVADGDHAWPTARTTILDIAGTSYTDFGCKIQGTDSSGNAAMATIKPVDGDGDVPRLMVYFRGTTAYTIVQNLIFDATGRPTDTSEYNAVEWRDVAQGPHKIRYCAMLGGATGTMPDGNRHLFSQNGTGSTGDQGIVEYCYFQNTPGNPDSFGLEFRYDHCLYLNDTGSVRSAVIFQYGSIAADLPASVAEVTNCTIYEENGLTTLDIFILVPASGVDAGTINAYSNLVWTDTAGTVEPFMGGSAASTSVTHAGTINANVLLGGDNVASGDMGTAGWYELPWDANDDDAVDPDTWPSDSVAYEVAAATVFNDPTSTYDWEMPNGLTITVLKDLRPIQYKTAGLLGDSPGALPVVADGGSTGETVSPEFLDVEPFYKPILLAKINLRLSTERNRVEEYVLRADIEDDSWNEMTARRMTLADSTEFQVRGGIETVEHLIVESDQAVRVNASDVAGVYLPAATHVVALGGAYTIRKIKNESGSAATFLIAMVD